MWEEEYYIFDSETISEKEFDEKVEYEDYQAFVDSMQGDEVVDRLNALHEENQALKSDRARYEEECRLDVFKELTEENEQLKKKIEKLHDLIFRLRTENAFDRATEKQSTITAKEFLDELDKW